MTTLILLVFAFVLACLAAWQAPQPEPYYPRLLAAALAFYFLACVLNNTIIAQHFAK